MPNGSPNKPWEAEGWEEEESDEEEEEGEALVASLLGPALDLEMEASEYLTEEQYDEISYRRAREGRLQNMVKCAKTLGIAMSDTEEKVLMELQRRVHTLASKGEVLCPLCLQTYGSPKSFVAASGAIALRKLVHLSLTHERRPYHNDEIYEKRSGYHLLAHFGLITRATQKDVERWGLPKCSGYWKPTLKGIRFVLGHIRVFKYCITRNKYLVGWSEDKISFREALGKKHDEDEFNEMYREINDAYVKNTEQEWEAICRHT